jgi:hypothetical protein
MKKRMMKKRFFTVPALLLALTVFLASCGSTDVVLNYSPGSLNDILDANPKLVTDNTEETHYYDFTVDGQTTLKISHDYSMTGDEDLAIVTPLAPFVAAGLDLDKLGGGTRADENWFYVTGSYGDGTGLKDNVTDSLFESVTFERSNLTYHEELDHYGIVLQNGKFEYAKDAEANDKDIVFVLAADPLAALGVDVNNVEGWIFMTMDNPDGTTIDVLLKPYDL